MIELVMNEGLYRCIGILHFKFSEQLILAQIEIIQMIGRFTLNSSS